MLLDRKKNDIDVYSVSHWKQTATLSKYFLFEHLHWTNYFIRVLSETPRVKMGKTTFTFSYTKTGIIYTRFINTSYQQFLNILALKMLKLHYQYFN